MAARRFATAGVPEVMPSEAELVARARAGDELAFELLVRRHSSRVFQIAGRFFRNAALVEEAAQQIFVRVFLQLARFEGTGSFEGWLARLATNLCLNEIRSRKRRRESSEEAESLDRLLAPSSRTHFAEAERGRITTDLALRLLEQLPPADRMVLEMLDGEGCAVREVAELTGWSEANVKVRAFRARRKLREKIQELL
jgi:RNA polymerase sigma-70 factor (ECF subfamily)